MVTIYVLMDNSQVRYIGKTSKTDLQEKLNQHIEEAISSPEKFEWISNALKKGQTPEIKSVLTFPEDQSEYYENLFIKDYKYFLGIKLNYSEILVP